MDPRNLINSEKEKYQQPMLKIVAVQTGRCILEGSLTELDFFGDHIE